MNKNLTYSELIDAGYVAIDRALQRGYVSRKNYDEKNSVAYPAGGSRKGQYYILEPNFSSTQYCFRQYYKKSEVN